MSRRHLTEKRTQDDSQTKIGPIRASVKLMVKAGLRARSQMREQGNKIDTIIDFQTHNEARFAKLSEAQTSTDRRLTELIEIFAKAPMAVSNN